MGLKRKQLAPANPPRPPKIHIKFKARVDLSPVLGYCCPPKGNFRHRNVHGYAVSNDFDR